LFFYYLFNQSVSDNSSAVVGQEVELECVQTNKKNLFQQNDIQQDEEEDNENDIFSSSIASSEDEDDECESRVGSVSSPSSSVTNDSAVKREKDRAQQRVLYNRNRGFDVDIDTCYSIKRILKEKIYPKVKILSDTEQQFLCPDFVGKAVDQSRLICDIILREMEMDEENILYKVRFWITYRSFVKNQLVKYRSNCVEDLKREYFKGTILQLRCCFIFILSTTTLNIILTCYLVQSKN